jgi:subtilisin family serine protease
MVVVAAGNQGSVGSSALTRHPWVIPVIACDALGWPIGYSNLGNSIGRRGLSAPGQGVTSLAVNGQLATFSGTSAAAPFVTGAIALLLSIFPAATAARLKTAITNGARRATVVPPLLDAWAAYQALLTTTQLAHWDRGRPARLKGIEHSNQGLTSHVKQSGMQGGKRAGRPRSR